jgi:hypothetical protein
MISLPSKRATVHAWVKQHWKVTTTDHGTLSEKRTIMERMENKLELCFLPMMYIQIFTFIQDIVLAWNDLGSLKLLLWWKVWNLHPDVFVLNICSLLLVGGVFGLVFVTSLISLQLSNQKWNWSVRGGNNCAQYIWFQSADYDKFVPIKWALKVDFHGKQI